MKHWSIKSLVNAALLGIAVIASSPSFAELSGPTSVAAFKAMDVDKNGKLTKAEYLAAMGKIFDKHAGAKGYCTPDEAAGVVKDTLQYFDKPEDWVS